MLVNNEMVEFLVGRYLDGNAAEIIPVLKGVNEFWLENGIDDAITKKWFSMKMTEKYNKGLVYQFPLLYDKYDEAYIRAEDYNGRDDADIEDILEIETMMNILRVTRKDKKSFAIGNLIFEHDQSGEKIALSYGSLNLQCGHVFPLISNIKLINEVTTHILNTLKTNINEKLILI